MKLVIWTALVTAASATGAALGIRLVNAVWRKVLHEQPPMVPGWARLVVEEPLRRRINRKLDAVI